MINLKLRECQGFMQGHSQANEVESGFMLLPDPKSVLSFFFFLTTNRLYLSSQWSSMVSFCLPEKWRGWTKWPLGFPLTLKCYESFASLLWDHEIRALYFPKPHLASVLSCSIFWRNGGSRSIILWSWPLCWCCRLRRNGNGATFISLIRTPT